MASTPLSPEIVREGEERARELRLYAARLEILVGGDTVGRTRRLRTGNICASELTVVARLYGQAVLQCRVLDGTSGEVDPPL